MVKESDIKSIGNASGADLILSGEVVMEEKRLSGKTLKEYSLKLKSKIPITSPFFKVKDLGFSVES